MGFWQTGYMEFHEPVGFDGAAFKPLLLRGSRVPCVQIYGSMDELRNHRFVAHTLHRPVMFLQGRELRTHPFRITRRISIADVQIARCDRVFFNGSEIGISSLPGTLSEISCDVCRVVLSKSSVEAEFELDIRVASETDMAGIEEQFRRTTLARRLDTRAVDEFISATSEFRSAIGYCDGVCAIPVRRACERTGARLFAAV